MHPQLISDPLESASIFHRTSPIASGSGIRCNCYSPALNRVSITQPDPRSNRDIDPYQLRDGVGSGISSGGGRLRLIISEPTTTRSCPS